MPGKAPAKRRTTVDVMIGRNVRVWRMRKGLTQEQLANRLGITFQQVQKYEAGANRIGTGRLVKIAGILGMPVATLLEGVEGGATANLYALIQDRRAYRLAVAFAGITDENCRLSLVNLVERIAADVPGARRRRGKAN